METALSLEQIKDSLRGLKPLRQRGSSISCDLTEALAYRDLMDVFLCLGGAGTWRWVDKEGKEALRQPLWQALANLLRDILSWPFLYIGQRLACRSLAGQKPLRWNAGQAGATVLYLRSDHWFNLKSGGSVGHIRGVVDSLRELGLRTVVASTDILSGVAQDGDFSLVRPQYGLGRNLPEMPHYLYNARLLRSIDTHWAAWRPACIYQRYSLGNYSGAALKKKYGVPLVLEYNGSFGWMMDHWGEKPLFQRALADDVERTNLQASDVIVVVSRALQEELVQRGVSAAKILVDPNGVDVERYSPAVDGNPVRNQYALEDKIVVGFIGTFGAWHGGEVLAQAIAHFAREYPEYRSKVRFLLIGDGQRLPAVKQIIAEGGLSTWVVLPGAIPQDEGPRYLAACNILVAPQIPNPDGSPFFGSPTKVFEYMAMGKGIVASDLDQIGEVLTHEQTAWLVRPGDVRDLMGGIKTLLDDGALRRRLGKAARTHVVQNYTWLAHTRRIVDFLAARN